MESGRSCSCSDGARTRLRPWDPVARVLFAPCWGGVGASQPAGGQSALGMVGWLGGQSGMVVCRAGGGRNDPGLPSCSLDQTEMQACTQKQNRICSCKPGYYCTLMRQSGCRLCIPQRRCSPGFGVVTPGMGPAGLRGPLGCLLQGHRLISAA